MKNKEFNLSEKIHKSKEKGLFNYPSFFWASDVKEFIRLLKEKAGNVNKKLGLHNVDECECCEKNWECVYEILELIDKLAGDKLYENDILPYPKG
jgi:hypothetical protein